MANVGLLFEKSRDFSWTDEQRKNAFTNAKYTFDTDEQFQDIPDDQVKKIKRGKSHQRAGLYNNQLTLTQFTHLSK
jgi:hypothetical protein